MATPTSLRTAAELPETVARRNTLLLGLDYVAFDLALAFLGPTTILPVLVHLLGGGPIAVGLLGMIISGAWLLPQFVAGRYLVNRPLIKKYIVVPAYLSRACLVLLVPALWWLSGLGPVPALAVLLLAYLAFTVGDALSCVAWLDLLGKAIPQGRRGRFYGTSQVLSGLLSVGAGALVAGILARPGPALTNHLLLIGLASALLMVSATATAVVREPRSPVQDRAEVPWREYLPRLGAIVRRDPRFAWLILVHWLFGLGDMAAIFYVLFAMDRLGMAEATVGLFVSARVVGSLVGGATLGPLCDRKGSAAVVQVITALRCLCPALALLAPPAAAWRPQLGLAFFIAIFVAAGVANGGQMTGFSNYTLDIAPPDERSLYISFANTLNGVLVLAPLAAGWLVRRTSYETLFLVALVMGLLGLLVAWRGQRLLARWWRAAEVSTSVAGGGCVSL